MKLIAPEYQRVASAQRSPDATSSILPRSQVRYSRVPGEILDDVDALRERLSAAGYPDTTVPNEHPHRKRVCFHDAEGNDWEFVEYRSADPPQRNDYQITDSS